MQNANSRNRFDKKDSLELGEKAEACFAEIARRSGWKISASSKAENIDEHWDFHIVNGEENFKVEVKSAKRVHRNDAGIQFEFTWVEIHGVRPNDTGWLFGKANLIAFEKQNSFILVKRLDLLALVNKKVNFVAKVHDPQEALYKIYRRDGRKDKLTLLTASDIEDIKFMELEKDKK
jgi:hypothetical protein